MLQITTRAEAKKRGLKYYYTGKPCGRGHDSVRQTSNANCVACFKEMRGAKNPNLPPVTPRRRPERGSDRSSWPIYPLGQEYLRWVHLPFGS